MFFKSVQPLIEFLNLKFTVKSATEGKLKVNIFFDIKDGADEVNLTPISVIATAEDLDSQLAEAIRGQLQSLPSIAQRVNLLLQSMKESEKKVTTKATGKKTPTKKATTTTTAKAEAPKVETPKEVDLFAAPKEEPAKAVVVQKVAEIVKESGVPKDNVIIASPKVVDELDLGLGIDLPGMEDDDEDDLPI